MKVNQRASGLNRDLPSNVCWSRCANYVKFTEEYVICSKMNVLYIYIYIMKIIPTCPRVSLLRFQQMTLQDCSGEVG